MGIGFGVQVGFGLFELFFNSLSSSFNASHSSNTPTLFSVIFTCSAFDLFQPRRHIRLFHLLQLGRTRLLRRPASSSSSARRAVDAFQLGGQRIDLCLLLCEIAGDDERLGDQVTGPALILLTALLVRFDDAVGLGFPAVGGDQVAVVLHRPGPVIHQMLVNVVAVDQRLAGVVLEQVFGQGRDQLLRLEARLPGPGAKRRFRPPGFEMLVHVRDEGRKFGMRVDRRFELRMRDVINSK